jgi:UDP-glucose 4-epimerase
MRAMKTLEWKILLIGSEGYAGGFLLNGLTSIGLDVTGVDMVAQDSMGSPNSSDRIQAKYEDLTESLLASFNLCIWLAGHSSVSMSVNDPDRAVANNVFSLFRLARTLQRLKVPLIYASSGSVYSSDGASSTFVPTENVKNPYDATKLSLDVLLRGTYTNAIALRFGTLSGVSPKMRWELVFNSMVQNAITSGEVWVGNSDSFRSILFLEHFEAYILKILEKLGQNWRPDGLVVLPLTSWSGSLFQLGQTVASHLRVKLVEKEGEGSYNFVMSTAPATKLLGRIRAPSITDQIEKLVNAIKNEN